MIERLKDPAVRKQCADEMVNNGAYDNPVLNNGWDNIVIASVASTENRSLEGKSLTEIAKLRAVEPAEVVFDLLIEEHAAVTMIIHWGEEEDVIRVMQHPLQMVGSDGIFGGKPHPRLYGSFQRVLGHYARDLHVFPLWEAVRKMTSAPAQLLRLVDRGLLQPGYKADIVVFNADAITDRATFDRPIADATGIEYVLVNGELVVKKGTYMNKTKGTVLRYK